MNCVTSHVFGVKTPGQFEKSLEHVRVQVSKIKCKDFIIKQYKL